MDKLPIIGISQGDVNGIGLEMILKTLSDPMVLDICTPVIYGSPKAAAFYRKNLELQNLNLNQITDASDASAKKINIINTSDEDLKVDIARATPEAGKAALSALQAMVEDAKNNKIDAMVTAPINREAYAEGELPFKGHSQYLQESTGEEALPLLVNEIMKIATATGHIALSKVPGCLTQELIIKKVKQINEALRRDFTIAKPRIAVLALNPTMQDEEENVIRPAVKRLNDEGLLCFGPHIASLLFRSKEFTRYDAILAMYHDQGQIAFNAISMDAGVNYTSNLPIIRTAPIRGTEYEIAGKNEASEESFRNAIYLAVDIIKNRKNFDEANKRPLK